MSDERQIDAAVRHAEARAVLPWSEAAPDEALMAREEAGEGEVLLRHAPTLVRLLGFLFADGVPECWENVAMRGLALMRHCAPSLLTGRDFSEVAEMRSRARTEPSFRLTEFIAECEESESARAALRLELDFLFPVLPGAGRGWLKDGCRRVYLLARNYQPEFVRLTREVSERVKVRDQVTGKLKLELRHFPKSVEMSYEDLARVFGEPVTSAIERRNARARWSAVAQRVIRKPIEANGGTVHLQFGKSASARATYAAKARGNQNRKGKGEGRSPGNACLSHGEGEKKS